MKTRPVAALIMVLLIIAGCYIGGFKALSKLSNEVEQVFANGADNDGYSIQRDLDEILAQSYNLVTIAKNYYEENSAEIMSVLDSRNSLSKAETPSVKYNCNQKLYESITELYFKLKDEKTLTETHKKLAFQYYTEILSRNDTIMNDSYNETVRKYNKMLTGFPTSFISMILGFKPAELFS